MGLALIDVSSEYSDGGGIRDFSAVAKNGAITVVMGPNGSGKSTLLKSIAGIVPYRGEISLEGKDLKKLDRRSIARHISFVEQAPSIRYPFSVAEILSMGRLPYGRNAPYNAATVRMVHKAAKEMDLVSLLNRSVTTLSGGELQRVSLARSLVQDSPVMLLDEPSSALDPGHVSMLFSLLRSLALKGKSIIITVHDVNLAMFFADDLWIIDRGRMTAKGVPEEMVNDEILSRVYGVGFSRYFNEKEESMWFFRH